MPQGWLDRCIFLPASGGLGDFVVASAVQGYLTPAEANAVNGTSYRYAAELRDASGNIIDWEVATGAYTAGTTTLARTTVEFSSNANAKVNFASPPNVMITALAADLGPQPVTDADYGDVVVSGSGTSWVVDAGVVTNAKLANIATARFKGRTTAGTGDPEDLTGTQATALLNAFTDTLKGLAPLSGGGTANFLRADASWAAPPSTSPGGSNTQVQYNNSSAFGGMSGTAWDDTNRALTLTGATVTASHPVFDLSQTWNSGGTTFTGLKLNITDTASATASLFADYQIGGSSYVKLGRGSIFISNPVTLGAAAVGFTMKEDFGDAPFNTQSCLRIFPGVDLGGHLYLGSPSFRISVFDLENVGSIRGMPGFTCQDALQVGLGTASQSGIYHNGNETHFITAANFQWFVGHFNTEGLGAPWGMQLKDDGAGGNPVRLDLCNLSNSDLGNYEQAAFDWITTANVFRIRSEAGGTGTVRIIAIDGFDKAGAAANTDLPSGTWALIHDTSGNTFNLVYNNAGTLKTVALV